MSYGKNARSSSPYVSLTLISGVTPEIVTRSEHLVTSAIVASATFALIAAG